MANKEEVKIIVCGLFSAETKQKEVSNVHRTFWFIMAVVCLLDFGANRIIGASLKLSEGQN